MRNSKRVLDGTYEDEQEDFDKGPNDLNVVCPAPVHVLINEARDQRADYGAQERAQCIDSHRSGGRGKRK